MERFFGTLRDRPFLDPLNSVLCDGPMMPALFHAPRGVTNFFVPLVPTVEESLQLRVFERILVEHFAVSVSQEVFGKTSNVLVGDLR